MTTSSSCWCRDRTCASLWSDSLYTFFHLNDQVHRVVHDQTGIPYDLYREEKDDGKMHYRWINPRTGTFWFFADKSYSLAQTVIVQTRDGKHFWKDWLIDLEKDKVLIRNSLRHFILYPDVSSLGGGYFERDLGVHGANLKETIQHLEAELRSKSRDK